MQVLQSPLHPEIQSPGQFQLLKVVWTELDVQKSGDVVGKRNKHCDNLSVFVCSFSGPNTIN